MTRVTLPILASLSLGACAHSSHERADITDPSLGGLCPLVSPLGDYMLAAESNTLPTTNQGVLPLARLDEERAYLDEAVASLAHVPSGTLTTLRSKLITLGQEDTDARTELERLYGQLHESHAQAKETLEHAAHCGERDLREPASPPASKSGADARTGRSRASSTCESAQRLWLALEEVDLTALVSVRSTAIHIKELTLDGDRGTLRDEVSSTLLAHGRNLDALKAALDTDAPTVRQRMSLRREISQQVGKIRIGCLATVSANERSQRTHEPPRSATVVVKPKWSGAVAEIAEDTGGFGSGFVVAWPGHDGHPQVRIITNQHVLDGADAAEIVAGNDDVRLQHTSDKATKPKPITATLVRAIPYDDIAILRVGDRTEADKLLRHALAFRRTPAKEREKVLASGFPGLGGTPSYQVTQGIVSNAKFGASDDDPEGIEGYIQHTAAIDPGNSGGPLLDGSGRLLGMNTLKAHRRENVGLAIPAVRIRLAMSLAERSRHFNVKHAQAACNAVLATLAAESPSVAATQRFGIALYEWIHGQPEHKGAGEYLDAISGDASNALELARMRAYAGLKALVAESGGVGLYDMCSDLREQQQVEHSERFVASAPLGDNSHFRLVFGREGEHLRLLAVEGLTPKSSP